MTLFQITALNNTLKKLLLVFFFLLLLNTSRLPVASLSFQQAEITVIQI